MIMISSSPRQQFSTNKVYKDNLTIMALYLEKMSGS